MVDKSRAQRARTLGLKLLSSAVASCFAASAFGNPAGPSVAAGGASFAVSGNALTVTNTPGAIINWQQFSIARDEITRFIQQNAASGVLNRVITQDPSVILGTLSSNGRVFLINANGITFGAGAVIDVAGFSASTLNLSDADWIAGRLRFSGSGAEGKLTNAGTIKTIEGGHVYLIAPAVENQAGAVITSPKGEIVIAAGKTVELVNALTPDLRVEFTAPENQAVNAGEVVAASGRVGIYGTLIKNSGIVSASRAEIGDGGKIVLRAVKDVTLDATSRLVASGAKGGTVTVQGETGTLLAQGVIEARGEEEIGGEIQLLAKNVGLVGSASVDASGNRGGGAVLVGGDYQGKNPEAPNADRTYVGPDVVIKANALTEGDGGKVVVWADEWTKYHGSIEAKGGGQGGNGGFVEVSGKEALRFDGRVDVAAANGSAGTVLLDPRDITIVKDATGGNDTEVSNSPPAASYDGSVLFGDGSSTADFTISENAVEALTGSIVLQATRDVKVGASTQSADLLTGGLTLLNQGPSERVVLQAGRHVEINSPLVTNGAPIWLEADSPHVNGYTGTPPPDSGADGAGAVRINADVRSFDTDSGTGGRITLLAGTTTSGGAIGGGFELNGIVNAGAGGIDVALTREATGSLSFFIGASGQAQFTSTDTGQLLSTGQLRIGEAITAGTDGLGTNSVTIRVDNLAVGTSAGGPVTLDSSAGSSVVFTAGTGGISIDRALTTDQATTITTDGALTINAPLTASGNSLTIEAASVSGTDNISGTFTCTGNGCPSTFTKTWDGEGGNLDWFTAAPCAFELPIPLFGFRSAPLVKGVCDIGFA